MKKKWLIVAIIISILLIGSGLAIIFNNKNKVKPESNILDKKDDNSNTDADNENTNNFNADTDNDSTDNLDNNVNDNQEEIDNFISVDNDIINNLDEESMTIIEMANQYLQDRDDDNLFSYLNESYPNLNDMKNEDKLWLTYWIVKDDEQGKYIEDYTSDEITAILKELFGKDFKIKYEDIRMVAYYYNKAEKKYVAGGGFTVLLMSPLKMVLTNYEKIQDKYYLTYKTAYYMSKEEPYPEIYNVKREVVDIFEEKEEIELYLNKSNLKKYLNDERFNKISNKLNETVYIFENQNNNLVLTGFLVK